MKTCALRHRRPLPLLLPLLLLLAVAAPARAFDWRPMPWGLATIWWDLQSRPTALRSLSMDVDIQGDLPEETRLYIAPLGAVTLDGISCYGGLQIGGNQPEGGRTRLALFSRWGERAAEAMRPVAEGFSVSAGYEGDFISVRRPVPWGQARYTVAIARQPEDPQWLAMTVTEHPSERRWEIGALRFPAGPGDLRPSIASFVEMFGSPPALDRVPSLRVVFHDLKVDGRPVPLIAAKAFYADTVPPLALAKAAGTGAVAVETGRFFARDGMTATRDGHHWQLLLGSRGIEP